MPGGAGRPPWLTALLPFPYRGDELHNHFLAVANHHRVHKVGQRFGIKGTGTAHTNNGIRVGSLRRMQGNSAQLQHGQNIGVAHLILEREAHHVKAIQGRAGFQRKQRDAFLFHQRFHVHPGHADPLAQGPGLLIDDAIKDFHAQVGHGHLIRIRKAEGEVHLRLWPGLDGGVHFAAGISGRLLHLLDHFLDLLVKQPSVLLCENRSL